MNGMMPSKELKKKINQEFRIWKNPSFKNKDNKEGGEQLYSGETWQTQPWPSNQGQYHRW